MFIIGAEYYRSELLAYVGSKQAQSGIIWGIKHPECVIITSGGKHSITAGYEDAQSANGSWIYFGQGARGDQNPLLYSNKLLTDRERSVLLFSTREPTKEEAQKRGSRSKRYRFEGVFGVQGWEYFVPGHGTRENDKLLLFHLVPANSIFYESAISDINEGDADAMGQNLAKIRDNLLSNEKHLTGFVSIREYRRACAQIRKYARLRANGLCELCKAPAPFIDMDGIPYLEVHHLHRLADDGPDIPSNVAALCPNCHRRAHSSHDKDKVGDLLKNIVIVKELAIEKNSPNSI